LTFSSGKSSSRVHVVVAKPDGRSAVSNASFLAILVGENSFLLCSEKELPMGKELNVDVVEDDILGIVVPVVNGE